MSSYRIQTKFIDRSERVNTSVPIYGATVINAPKGPNDFFFFDKGESQKILNTFGYPSASYPQIQDAIDFNSKAGLWLSAPYTAGKFGGVFVTKFGTIPFVSGVSTKTITDYTAIPCVDDLATGNGVTLTFTKILENFAYYKAQSIDILVNGTSINVTATSNETEALTTNPAVGTGTLNTTTGALSFTFTTAPVLDAVITISYKIDLGTNVYFTLFDRDSQADDVQVMVTADDTTPGAFYITVYRYDPIDNTYLELSDSPIHVSIDSTIKDGYGNVIYIETVFDEDEQTLFSVDVVNSVFTTFVDDTVAVPLTGGNRGTAIAASNYITSFNLLTDKNRYPTKIIFDTTGLTEIATAFETLRAGELNRVRFLYPTANLSATAILADPLVAGNTTNRGLYCYCLTWGIHKDLYQGRNFLCSNMGLIASRMADVLIYGPGGVPAWIDENNIGGQLGGSIVKFSYNATEAQLEQLDSNRLNPVVNDPSYGPMIKSWRTRQLKLSDYSYIGQSSLADWIVDLIEVQVLPLQIGKAIDDFHMGQVRGKCESVLNSVSQWLEEFAVVCDRTNNTADTMAQQKFILTVGVKFTAYSSTILFSFVNVAGTTTVTESIAS